MEKAEWIDPKACMSIELPASCLKDGAITIYEAPTAEPKKRAKATSLKDGDEAPAAEPKKKAKAKAKAKKTKGKAKAAAHMTEAASEKVAAESETLDLDGSGPGQGAGPELQVRRNNLEALDLLKISIMKRPRSFEAVDGDTATALFHVLKPHGASGADIYGNVCMKTGIDLKQLQAQEETLFDLVHLQTTRYCQWARDGHRNRWEAQEDDAQGSVASSR